jgi:hypothetical protein
MTKPEPVIVPAIDLSETILKIKMTNKIQQQ